MAAAQEEMGGEGVVPVGQEAMAGEMAATAVAVGREEAGEEAGLRGVMEDLQLGCVEASKAEGMAAAHEEMAGEGVAPVGWVEAFAAEGMAAAQEEELAGEGVAPVGQEAMAGKMAATAVVVGREEAGEGVGMRGVMQDLQVGCVEASEAEGMAAAQEEEMVREGVAPVC
ncbi:hypothetical protein AB1Y20_014409 [Prymnesium parvum]|uniref:Uncharacterized protein n=1 Tax=Prymnesium parvum TaxID=97485 RepID=A0AB34IG85_PRYPA